MKQVFRKLVSFLLAITIVFGMNNTFGILYEAKVDATSNEFTIGYNTYEIENGEASLVQVSTEANGDVEIDSTADGYPVTAIKMGAFRNCILITGISIPKNITKIEDYAFEGCSSIKYFFVAEDNESYSSENGVLFNRNKTELIQYPAGNARAEYDIPTSVMSISGYAFDNSVLYNDVDNWDDNALYIDNCLIKVKDREGSYKIKDGTTTIAAFAFYCLDKLSEIIIPESVNNLSYSCFYWCGNLSKINIPFGVSEIPNTAFYHCDSLVELVLPESVISIGDSAFMECFHLVNINIPSKVTKIGDRAFYGCSEIQNISIPDKVISIGKEAFADCDSLDTIKIPDSVVSIGDSAFEYMWKLEEVILSENLKVIKKRTFFHCSEMTSIEIPESVTVIEDSAFGYCGSLESINIPSGVTEIGRGAFEQCCSAKGKIEIPYGVTEIKDVTFDHCNNIDAIIIPETVTKIGNFAFGYCTSLEEIKIPESVTEIGDYAFLACHNLQSLIIPNGVKSLGKYLIGDYSQKDDSMAIENVHIPASVTVIGENMFGDCSHELGYNSELGYICSDTADCYAKAYAEINGIEFKVCDGHGESETEEEPSSIFDVIVASIVSVFDTAVNWFRNLFKPILEMFGKVGL